MMFGRNLRGKPQAITRPANILSCVVTPDLEIRRHDLAFAIGPRVIEVQADERVTRLDAVHAASFQAFTELAIEAAVPQAFVEAVDRQCFFAPRR